MGSVFLGTIKNRIASSPYWARPSLVTFGHNNMESLEHPETEFLKGLCSAFIFNQLQRQTISHVTCTANSPWPEASFSDNLSSPVPGTGIVQLLEQGGGHKFGLHLQPSPSHIGEMEEF